MKNVNTVQGMTAFPANVEQAKTLDNVKMVKRVGAYAMLAMLIGFAVQLVNSAGDIGVQEKNVIFVASALTLLLVVPIIAVNIYFVSRQRASNTTAKHSSSRSHSIKKEVVTWAAPIVTVAVLTLLSWGITHSLAL